MAIIDLETQIPVPIEQCFDLARDIGLHCRTAAHTQERAVAGRTTGLFGPGDFVTFEAVHFGVRQRLTSHMTDYDRPTRFSDTMSQGAFQSLQHLHEFTPDGHGGTIMHDRLTYTAPFGVIGRLFDYFVLERYMRRFLETRNRELKRFAEAESYLL